MNNDPSYIVERDESILSTAINNELTSIAAATADSSLFTIEQLLPHAAPMILIDRMVEVGEKSIHCQVNIDQHLLFFEEHNHSVPAYVGIEFMAQTIAAWSGFHALQKKQPSPIGFLLGCRRYHTNVSHFNQGQQLDIYATQILEDHNMAVFLAEIKHQQKIMATSQLNVYVPKSQQLQSMKMMAQSVKEQR